MKIAIIGGNLLGTATALNLSLAAEADSRRPASAASCAAPSAVVVYEQRDSLGGNAFRSVPIPAPSGEDKRVEVGHARCLAPTEGSFLFDLCQTANGARGAFRILGRNFRVPGDTALRRGAFGAAQLVNPVTSAKFLPSFCVWQWDGEVPGDYVLRHGGYRMVDLFSNVISGPGLRAPFLAGAFVLGREAMKIRHPLTRGVKLLSPLILIAIAVLGPAVLARRLHANLAFWMTTATLLAAHGLTMGIARGAVLGFQKHLSTVCEKNAGTCALSVGILMQRTKLDRYVQASADDIWNKFKYDMVYAKRYLEPLVSRDYAMRSGAEINSLAANFSLLSGDWTNMDATAAYATVAPENAALCSALLQAASAKLSVNTKLETRVKGVSWDSTTRKYLVKAADGTVDAFDGVVMCANVDMGGDMEIELPNGVDVRELLGSEGPEEEELNPPSAASHTAIVKGLLEPKFFGFGRELDVPDRVQANDCPYFAYFERVAAPDKEDGDRGVYLVDCSAKFDGPGGLMQKMFSGTPEILHFEPRPPIRHSASPLSPGEPIDNSAPFLVFGNRFIYAAATDRLCRHPELDAIAAMNAASLFSSTVDWEQGSGDVEEEGESDFPQDQ